MHPLRALLLVLATGPAAALAKLTINNKCLDPLYYWVDHDGLGPMNTLKQASKTDIDVAAGTTAVKITTKENGLFSGAPVQFVAYTLDEAFLWIDASTINGNPFEGKWLEVSMGEVTATCRNIVWENGTYPKPDIPGMDTRACPTDMDFTMTVCV